MDNDLFPKVHKPTYIAIFNVSLTITTYVTLARNFSYENLFYFAF